MWTALVLVTAASAATVDFVCTPGGQAGVVGLPPVAVTCDVVAPTIGSWDEVSWTFGDGAVIIGDSASFTYEDVGQYSVTVRLENFEDPGDPDAADPVRVRHFFVTVCGLPVPAFDIENVGGLEYRAHNSSEIMPGCLDTTRWTVFSGSAASGEPLFDFVNWEPRFALPDEGPYVVRLEQAGLAGAATAELPLDAKFQVPDRLKELNSSACAAAPAGGAWLGLLLLAALARRARW